jgi:anti-sigma B factor antagonist
VSTFSVRPEQADGEAHAWLLTVAGELDATSAAVFDEAVEAALEGGARLMTLDLSDVSFLDSSGLRSVVHASHRMTERGGRLAVAGLSGAAQRVLELTGLIDRLRHDETPE